VQIDDNIATSKLHPPRRIVKKTAEAEENAKINGANFTIENELTPLASSIR
jgi:hypothetical protein